MSNQENIDKNLYNPTFQWAFLHPKHWGTWLGILFAVLLAFVPAKPRDKFARYISGIIVGKNGRVVRRTRLNLQKCFQKSLSKRYNILSKRPSLKQVNTCWAIQSF